MQSQSKSTLEGALGWGRGVSHRMLSEIAQRKA